MSQPGGGKKLRRGWKNPTARQTEADTAMKPRQAQPASSTTKAPSNQHPPHPDESSPSPAATSPFPNTMPQYTSRDVGDPSQIKKNKQSMADLKLRRLTELNNRLREDLERERIPVSQAAKR